MSINSAIVHRPLIIIVVCRKLSFKATRSYLHHLHHRNNIQPKKGIFSVERLATTVLRSTNVTNRPSMYVLCGAVASTVASADDTRFPRTVTQKKPPTQNSMRQQNTAPGRRKLYGDRENTTNKCNVSDCQSINEEEDKVTYK